VTGQVEIDFDRAVDPAATATIDDVERLVGVLREHGQLTAAEIAAHLGLSVSENSKRKVRAIARAARPGVVSCANSAGYKLLQFCTLPEIWACISTWDKIERDARLTKAEYLRVYHARGGG
jgi:hypothetical protein